MTRYCSAAACWCRRWPPVRLILSTGQTYTVEELPGDGAARVFRYVYRDAA